MPPDLPWPPCASCGHPLRFLAQLRLDTEVSPRGGLLVIFMCGHPDTCATFDAHRGATDARVVAPSGLAPRDPPSPDALLRFVAGARIETATPDADDPAEAYDVARATWGGPSKQRQVLGQLGGICGLITNEAPSCECGTPMHDVAQLEEGPDHATAMNFGGGSAFAFVCGRCEG